MWQDYVLTGVQFFFWITLLPMLRAKEKPPLAASIPTGLLLLIAAFATATLHLWFAAASHAITGVEWLLLAYQRMHSARLVTSLREPASLP